MSEKKYSKIQMIGLAISTTPGDLRSIEETNDDGRYLGVDDVGRDIYNRLIFLRHAIEQAFIMHDKSSDVLKVFTIPEFFFRGNKGAYLGENQKIFQNHFCDFVTKFLNQEMFADWLFVLGTLLTSKTKADCSKEPAKSQAEVGASLVSVYDQLHQKNNETILSPAQPRVVESERSLAPRRSPDHKTNKHDPLPKELRLKFIPNDDP